MYLRFHKTYEMELFSKNSERVSLVNYFANGFILDVWLDSEYASDYDTQYWFVPFGILL